MPKRSSSERSKSALLNAWYHGAINAPLTSEWDKPKECPNSWAATVNKLVPENKNKLR